MSKGKMRKARHGRRRHPAPHRDHHNPRAISDPISKAMKGEMLKRRREDDERVERAAWEGGR